MPSGLGQFDPEFIYSGWFADDGYSYHPGGWFDEDFIDKIAATVTTVRAGDFDSEAVAPRRGLFDSEFSPLGMFDDEVGSGAFTAIVSGGVALSGTSVLEKTKVTTAAGGITLAGSAALAKTKVGSASGGLTLSGIALTNHLATHTYVPSGGLIIAGSASLLKEKAAMAAGGLALAGSASLAKSKVMSASGGLTFAGAASRLKEKVAPSSGGLSFAGAANLLKEKVASALGGAVFGGSAITSYQVGGNTYTYVASGGLLFAGVADANRCRFYVYAASGALLFSGIALTNPARNYAYMSSGGLLLSGAADLLKEKAFLASGGLRFRSVSGVSFPVKFGTQPSLSGNNSSRSQSNSQSGRSNV